MSTPHAVLKYTEEKQSPFHYTECLVNMQFLGRPFPVAYLQCQQVIYFSLTATHCLFIRMYYAEAHKVDISKFSNPICGPSLNNIS